MKAKEFKDSPVGKIPKDWDFKALSELADVDRGKFTYRPRNDPRLYGGSHPFIQTGDIASASGGILTTYSQTLNERGISVSRQFPVGTIAITIAANIADTAILGIPMYFPDSVVGAVVKKPNSIRYIELCIHRAKQQLEARAPQSAQKNINLEDLRPLLIPVPSTEKQQKIAEIIDTIDKAIALTDTHITKLKKAKAGLLHDLLTRGIDEHGELRDPTRNPELFKRSLLGIIPKDWDVVRLESICERVTDGSHQSVTTSDTGIPFLYVSCIRDGRILWEQAARISETIYKEISRGKEPKHGLILYTVVGSYGHAALIKNNRQFSFQRHIAYIIPNQEKIIPGYLCLWLNSPNCKIYADKVALGNAQKTVTLGALNAFPIALSETLEEQKHILEYFDVYEKEIANKETRLEKLKLLKKGLMSDLLTGRVRVKI
ncbi:restriction endonuclease subunit S [Nostoc sp.]|uniref:restriction endonuclease subunit S n=1 Tax=Nostoc sp. TaxID=1180 RepID=UPI002FFA5DE7